MKHRRTHFLTDSPTLVREAEPRSGLYGAKRREIDCHQALNTHHFTVNEHGAIKALVVRTPRCAVTPAPFHHSSLELWRGLVGPRMEKGHRSRIMNSLESETRKIHQVVVVGQPNFDS
jgi:hypothetical protein